MATTPPPPSVLREPPTPRHGAGYDSYDPYPPRQSARLANQRSKQSHATTPSPPSSPLQSSFERLSPPGSGAASPRKSGSAPRGKDKTQSSSSTDPADEASSDKAVKSFGDLITPAKTPRKKAVDAPGSTAQQLFPTGSTKKTKKYTGFTLDSFHEDPEPNSSKIEIYTDTRDRIPQVNNSESNPFISTSKPKPATRRRKVTAEADKADDIDPREYANRKDGMLYVFRGKKIFRKFPQGEEEEADNEDDDLGLFAQRPDLLDESVTRRLRPSTQSRSVARVLFPTNKEGNSEERATGAAASDEEAPTDVEEPLEEEENVEKDLEPEAETGDHSSSAPTTSATAELDSTPPTRTLRSRTIRHEASPSKDRDRVSRNSPFRGWMRKKQQPTPANPQAPAASTRSRKRDTSNPPEPASKKTRAR